MENNKLSKLTQASVPEHLAQVEAQIKAIEANLPEKGNTSIEIEEYGKISEIKKVSVLVALNGHITEVARIYKDSCKEMEKALPELVKLKIPECKIEGHTVSVVKKAILFRIGEVIIETQLKGLKNFRTKLEESLSEEAKYQKRMEKLQAEMNAGLLD
jgi:hypothetical protein